MKSIKFLLILVVINITSCKRSDLNDGLYANIETEKGNVLLSLHYKQTPLTVANFVSLAEGTNKNIADSLQGKNFYEGLPFHRVIPDFMIQGGDIKRDGSGDPGYKFADEFPKDKDGNLLFKHDKKGVLSMANSGRNTNGSQFFITHKETSWLDNKHTIFGEVIEGFNVVDSIQQGDKMRIEIIRIGRSAKKFDADKTFNGVLEERLKKQIADKLKRKSDSVVFFKEMKEEQAIVLASGLKVLETKKGNGIKVKEGDRVTVHYTGYFADGSVFQTTLEKNEPFQFTVGVDRVIKGWTEGVQHIEIGGSGRLFIPYQLAYGPNDYGPILGKSSLIFDVDVVKIKK